MSVIACDYRAEARAAAQIADTAAAYREEAKRIFKRIEDCAVFTQDVRKTCEEVKRKMAVGSEAN